MMPNYDLGDRKLIVAPQVKSPTIRWAEIGNEVASAGGAVANALDHVRAVRAREAQRAQLIQERSDENEANYRVALAVDEFKNKWNGQEIRDEKTGALRHIPGVAERTYAEFERDGTTPVNEMEKMISDFRQSDIYTKMNPAQRQYFDRAWFFKTNEFRRAAQARQLELKAQHRQEQMKVEDAADDKDVLMVEGADSSVFEGTAGRAAARKIFRRYGSTVTTDINPHDPNFSIYDIKILGAKENDPATEEKYSQMWREYQAVLQTYQVNRITNLTRLAEQDVPGADQMLAEARKTVYEMSGKDPEGKDVYIAKEVDENGRATSTEMVVGTISDNQSKQLHALIDKAGQKLTDLRERKTDKARQEEFAKYKEYIGGFELALLDPKKVDETIFDYDGFESRLDKDPLLTETQKQALLKDYRTIENYKKKYDADKKEAEAEIAAGVAADKLTHGFFRDDGVFIPSSAFPKKSEDAAVMEFAKSEPMWQDPKTALIKVEAARMTGRLKKEDYLKFRAYGEMMLEDKAKEAWLKIYPELGIDDAKKLGVGEDSGDLSYEQKNARLKWKQKYGEKSSYNRYVQNGVYAKTQGNAGGVDWLADSLEGGEDEELIPAETMTEVYRTVMQFSRAGVDPMEAVRQILAPTIENGIQRSLKERLSDPDYMKEVIAKTRRESGYYDDLAQNRADQKAKSDEYRPRTAVLGNQD